MEDGKTITKDLEITEIFDILLIFNNVVCVTGMSAENRYYLLSKFTFYSNQ